jgi:hypothetical protein
MVLATMPLPANPIETNTGFERPGTVSLSTRIEYAGELAGQAVRPLRSRQCLENETGGFESETGADDAHLDPESTWTALGGDWRVGGE